MSASPVALYSTAGPSWGPRVRNLGGAILVTAINDYKDTEEAAHHSAREFLYPVRPECKEHYDWVISITGINEAWMREMLDSFKSKWDLQRQHKMKYKRDWSRSARQVAV